MPRAKQRTPELRDRVLRVALATLATEGVVGLTTRKVAEVARTSTPAVYELFGDKAGLVREIFFEGFRMLRGCLDRLDETDIAHVLVSLTQGLAGTELAGWLGTSRASVDRRWKLAIRAVLDGLRRDARPVPSRGHRRQRRRTARDHA